MVAQPSQSASNRQLHDLIEELADQLCPAVDGEFDFLVKVSAHDESIDKLQMLINLVLDSASRAIEELRGTKDYTENIIRSMIDMLLVVAPDGRIVTVNEATCNRLGYREEELIGQRASMLFSEEEDITQLILSHEALPEKRMVLPRLVREGFIASIEKSLLARGGAKIPVVMSGAVMRDNDGHIRGIVCLAQDITERKRAEEELRVTVDELQRFNRFTVGREERMIELKREVNEIARKAGIPPPYDSALVEGERIAAGKAVPQALRGPSDS